jgi:hypothetical protein
MATETPAGVTEAQLRSLCRVLVPPVQDAALDRAAIHAALSARNPLFGKAAPMALWPETLLRQWAGSLGLSSNGSRHEIVSQIAQQAQRETASAAPNGPSSRTSSVVSEDSEATSSVVSEDSEEGAVSSIADVSRLSVSAPPSSTSATGSSSSATAASSRVSTGGLGPFAEAASSPAGDPDAVAGKKKRQPEVYADEPEAEGRRRKKATLSHSSLFSAYLGSSSRRGTSTRQEPLEKGAEPQQPDRQQAREDGQYSILCSSELGPGSPSSRSHSAGAESESSSSDSAVNRMVARVRNEMTAAQQEEFRRGLDALLDEASSDSQNDFDS